MTTMLRKFLCLAPLLVIAFSLVAAVPGSGASVKAIHLDGDYLGTYTPAGGSASQLQMLLDPPGTGGAFVGQGTIRVDGVTHEIDIAGTVKKKSGKINFKATLTGTEFNDNVKLTGKLKGDKISGKFSGTVGGPTINGSFSLTKI